MFHLFGIQIILILVSASEILSFQVYLVDFCGCHFHFGCFGQEIMMLNSKLKHLFPITLGWNDFRQNFEIKNSCFKLIVTYFSFRSAVSRVK